jgi:type IV pilus assembly protein PilC
LEEALRALKLYYEGKEQMNRRMRSALLHPTFLTILLMVVLGVLLTRVVPTFQSVYASLGGQMTGVAGSLLRMGLWLKESVWVFYGLLGLVVCLVLLYVGCRPFREMGIRIWKRALGDRGVMRKVNDAAIAGVIAMGLGSGLLLEETMELAADVMADVPQAKKRCLQCREALESGIPLVDALKNSEVFPPSSCRLLSVGLQGGNGDTVMRDIAEKLSNEADEALAGKIDKVEPALVLAVSILVGMILLMVMLPLMNIMETIG